MTENCYAIYKNNSILHSSKEKLLLLILDEAVKQGKIAKKAMEENKVQIANTSLMKMQNIFLELRASLENNINKQKWMENMIDLYMYIYNMLIKINVNKDIKLLDEVLPLVSEIRDIWYEASNKI